jgi:hypothetical protein
VHAYAPSQRTALFKHAIETGKQQEATSRALLLRLSLIANSILVKPTKSTTKESTTAPAATEVPNSPTKAAASTTQPEEQNGTTQPVEID